MAFATIKEFFVKYSNEDLNGRKLSEMLSEDVNNMFFDVKFVTQKNKDAIAHIKGSQI